MPNGLPRPARREAGVTRTTLPAPSSEPVSDPKSFKQRFGVSRETVDRLIAYEALLGRWQQAKNLVSKPTLDEVWSRHFADSAQVWQLARAQAPGARLWLDLGSGAGFPGMVAAILAAEAENGPEFHLIESNGRKCAFLEAVRRETGVKVSIHARRIEACWDEFAGAADVISARALAPVRRLCALAYPFSHEETIFLWPKGRDVACELTEATKFWTLKAETVESQTSEEGRILIVRKLHPIDPSRR